MPRDSSFGHLDRNQGKGVFILQNFLLLAGAHICVALCSLDRAVSQYGLDDPDIHVLVQEGFGEGMPEHVWGNVQLSAGPGGVFVDHIADGLVRYMPGFFTGEEVSIPGNLFLKDILVSDQRFHDARFQLQEPFLCAFSEYFHFSGF